ncbi:P-loop NTPase fold protein [Pontibacter toksunensis]|uniref:P-loop NTPase fold protein n=1 Tax=Pontibacter toksunensis TaxID=1332631 RepID=A0ABW6BTC3_9BACT
MLDRQKYARVLTGIINLHPTGFVLAINNKWGTGKTTFIKMWEQELKDDDFKTLYFNAWENDFENNPLTALMGELKTLTKEPNEPKFGKALKNAAMLSKHIAPIMVQAIVDRYVINTELLKDAIVDVSRGVNDIFENEVNEYANKKKNIKEFRNSLSDFISKVNKAKPLIFIIDELDRCRPNYAVSILEQIKHFFSVPNIVFVLSIDKVQLGNAVRGVYGSDAIDSDEYLRRFIDIEYSIPEPDKGSYYNYLYNYFDFDNFFNSEIRRENHALTSDGREFLNVSEVLFKDTSLSLRKQEKIFAHARLALRSYNARQPVVPSVFLLMVYLKVVDDSFYSEIRKKALTIEQLQQKFLTLVQGEVTKERNRELLWLEGYLILFYNNFVYTPHTREHVYKRNTAGEKELVIKSVTNPLEEKGLLSVFDEIDRKGIGDFEIDRFLKRIDLTEHIHI